MFDVDSNTLSELDQVTQQYKFDSVSHTTPLQETSFFKAFSRSNPNCELLLPKIYQDGPPVTVTPLTEPTVHRSFHSAESNLRNLVQNLQITN